MPVIFFLLQSIKTVICKQTAGNVKRAYGTIYQPTNDGNSVQVHK